MVNNLKKLIQRGSKISKKYPIMIPFLKLFKKIIRDDKRPVLFSGWV